MRIEKGDNTIFLAPPVLYCPTNASSPLSPAGCETLSSLFSLEKSSYSRSDSTCSTKRLLGTRQIPAFEIENEEEAQIGSITGPEIGDISRSNSAPRSTVDDGQMLLRHPIRTRNCSVRDNGIAFLPSNSSSETFNPVFDNHPLPISPNSASQAAASQMATQGVDFNRETSDEEQMSESQSSSSSENSLGPAFPTFMCATDGVGQYLERHQSLVSFWFRHRCTDAAMDDLMGMWAARAVHNGEQHEKLFKSWKGVKSALYRSEALNVSTHSMCSAGHRRLPIGRNEVLSKCDTKGCRQNVKTYEYLGIWERLHVRLQDKELGSELFDYFRGQLNVFERSEKFHDVFDGRLFREAVGRLGGPEAVRNDIFLILSGDGAQPFKSTPYDMWPFLCMMINLEPSKRVNTANMLPLLCVPGPRAPKDLISFLDPFIEEMKELSRGKECVLWNGDRVTVRCHLLFICGDLPAIAKLCQLKGSNGYSPCRYCNITGIVDPLRSHVYYPSFFTRGDQHEICFDTENIPKRSESGIEETLQKIQDLSLSSQRGSKGMLETLRRCSGINGESALFERLPLLRKYRSCPIDIMHLLLLNVSAGFIDMLFDRKLLHNVAESRINDVLHAFGSGVPADVRRPRSLRYRRLFKASEWKFFVLNSSLIAFHEELDREVLQGWFSFVQVVDICFRPVLTEGDVVELGEKARHFYRFYESTFYGGNAENLHACKYVIHLLLHLEDSVRDCGPLVNLSQFPMERFIGETVQSLSARNLAAESMMEQSKFREAYKMNLIRTKRIQCAAVGIFEPRSGLPSASLHTTSSLVDFCGIVFCHPRSDRTISALGHELNVDLSEEITAFYCSRVGLSKSEASELVNTNPDIRVWGRMAFAEQFKDRGRVLYIGNCMQNQGPHSRRNYYIAGEYLSNSQHNSDSESAATDSACHSQTNVFYGRVKGFIEHRLCLNGNYQTFLMVLADWVVDGLHKGDQCQVYAKLRRDDNRLFSKAAVDGADIVRGHISVVETSKLKRGRNCYKTYFVDDNILRDKLLFPRSAKLLCGFKKKDRDRLPLDLS